MALGTDYDCCVGVLPAVLKSLTQGACVGYTSKYSVNH